jgi:hypothetical protein
MPFVNIYVKKQQTKQLFIQFIYFVWLLLHVLVLHCHSILSTAPQLSISQRALAILPEDGNVMPKYVGATIHN